jgi:hypothetical protein
MKVHVCENKIYRVVLVNNKNDESKEFRMLYNKVGSLI